VARIFHNLSTCFGIFCWIVFEVGKRHPARFGTEYHSATAVGTATLYAD
jgi:hypothetical protein